MTLLQRDREKFEEGKIEELLSLVREGLLQADVAAKRLGITVAEFEKCYKSRIKHNRLSIAPHVRYEVSCMGSFLLKKDNYQRYIRIILRLVME